jgi:RimJ/RimL family protein N-acetyltransferase
MNPFQGELVRLAQIDKDSLPTYVSWFRDYEVQRWLDDDVVVPLTDEAEAEWYDEAIKGKNAYWFEIRTLEGDHLIGSCGIFDTDTKNRSAELGIVIGEKDYWGKGYGTDAVQTLLRFAFGEVNLNRVYLQVFAYNQRAIRSYEKCGFRHEGTARQAQFREGRYHDVHIMAILFEEWQRHTGSGA